MIALAIIAMLMLWQAVHPAHAGEPLPTTGSGIAYIDTMTTNLKKAPLGEIVLENFGTLRPPEDITAEESAWLAVLVLQVAIHSLQSNPYRIDNPDYGAFVHQHHLERLFAPAVEKKCLSSKAVACKPGGTKNCVDTTPVACDGQSP